MSNLQEAAKPYLVPILENKPTVLRRNAKVALSAWATMTVMVSEHINHEMVAIPKSARQWFMENKRPPSHWRIWIAHHSAHNHDLFSHNVATLATDEEIKRVGTNAANEPNSHSTTILLGNHLLIYAMSSSMASGRRFVRQWRHPTEIAAGLIPIWPPGKTPIIWPPPLPYRGLNDAGINLLASAFLTEVSLLADLAD
jgi:hypothetical protein